jgi:hypothetical protein
VVELGEPGGIETETANGRVQQTDESTSRKRDPHETPISR